MRIGATKIVVGWDGTPQSRDALRLGELLARTAQVKLLVVRVYEKPRSPEELAGEIGELLAPCGTGCEPLALSGSSPPRVLHELAQGDSEIGLIITGSTHRAGLGRVLPGATAQRLLSGAPCAVAVAPRGFAGSDEGPLEHADDLRVIEVGLSWTEESEAALGLAARLAGRVGATLRVIAVSNMVASPETMAAQRRAGAPPLFDLQTVLYEKVAELPEELRAQPIFKRGDPGSVLLSEAENGVDLIVIGSRGYGPVRAALLGGVSARVIGAAPCPVLITPRSSV